MYQPFSTLYLTFICCHTGHEFPAKRIIYPKPPPFSAKPVKTERRKQPDDEEWIPPAKKLMHGKQSGHGASAYAYVVYERHGA